ncbi:MAG: glycosyltransferase family 9 protein [Duganella sp.]
MNTVSPSRPLTENGGPLAAALLFSLAALGLSSAGLALVQLVVLIIFARNIGPVWRAYRRYWGELRAPVLAFMLYFLVSLLRMVFEPLDASAVDGPARLVFGLAFIGVIAYLRPPIRYFWLGLCLATVVAAVMAVYQVASGQLPRAIGFTHHPITFGDLALASGLMAVCGLSALRGTRLAWLPALGLLCGIVASVMSSARGSWVALPLVLIPLLIYGTPLFGRRLLGVCALAAAACVLAYLVPATDVAQRLGVIHGEVVRYFTVHDVTHSVGIRLELWRASLMMFADHPWLGVGRDGFHAALQALVDAGRLQPSLALTFSSSHNDLLHCLATGGLLDASVLVMMYAAPLIYFARQLRRADDGQHAPALAGMVLVTAFIAFGLTDVMFWLMMTKVFYVMMVCCLIGLCVAVRGNAQPPRRILITRTDNIGDVVLTLPLAGYLRKLYPQAEILFLCRRYAAAVVAQCRHVDRVVTIEELGDDLAAGLRATGCDTVLFVFPRRPLAHAARRAGIERRIGSMRRFYHWTTCNRLAHITSAESAPLHEAQRSFQLLRPLGVEHIPTLDEVVSLYGLDTPRDPAADAVLAGGAFNLILHPKSNGNGREWPLAHFTTLARMLGVFPDVRVLVTGSAAEGELLAQQAQALLALPNVENLCGRLDLAGFTALIGGCDGLIASGTGPLHLAAALGRPVVGLFPPIEPIHPVRWAALGIRAHNLVNAAGCGQCADPARCTCMEAIAPQQVFDIVQGWRAAPRAAA